MLKIKNVKGLISGLLLILVGACAPIFKNHEGECHALNTHNQFFYKTGNEFSYEDWKGEKQPRLISGEYGKAPDKIWFGVTSDTPLGKVIFYEPYSIVEYPNQTNKMHRKMINFMNKKGSRKALKEWGLGNPYEKK